MKGILKGLMVLLAVMGAGVASAVTIPMYLTTGDGYGRSVGTVEANDTIYGLILKPRLHGLPPGVHGFHVHAMGMCEHDGMAAGGHLDPDKTDEHLGPYGNGHLGDLPVLIVDDVGKSRLPVLAPRLKLSNLDGKALMIHVGGDNYSDYPEKLGGGGGRLACGVIPYHH